MVVWLWRRWWSFMMRFVIVVITIKKSKIGSECQQTAAGQECDEALSAADSQFPHYDAVAFSQYCIVTNITIEPRCLSECE
jgi:hypothetical protein